MKIDTMYNEEQEQIISQLIQRQKEEKLATATLVTETLAALNISVDSLPQKSQQTLHQLTVTQASLHLDKVDPIAISLQQTNQLADTLDDEYEILKLKQKNAELQRRIDANKKFIESLRRELEWSRESLANRTPGPDDIHEYIRQVKQKVASYEENCEKAKAKLSKLSVPDAIMPKTLSGLVASLETLRKEAASLRQRADDVTLARDAIDKLNRLRR
ncbi:uncharacterized protein LOC115451628 [Manduca sexta]|uniref:uncharacterized protein LOC115451628 n=1 Tax=Manduca sexta TaxID=7130 RepID=UPI00188DF304|nr:uncharacterized protein LOC115451628 [Manduca sexta]